MNCALKIAPSDASSCFIRNSSASPWCTSAPERAGPVDHALVEIDAADFDAGLRRSSESISPRPQPRSTTGPRSPITSR